MNIEQLIRSMRLRPPRGLEFRPESFMFNLVSTISNVFLKMMIVESSGGDFKIPVLRCDTVY